MYIPPFDNTSSSFECLPPLHRQHLPHSLSYAFQLSVSCQDSGPLLGGTLGFPRLFTQILGEESWPSRKSADFRVSRCRSSPYLATYSLSLSCVTRSPASSVPASQGDVSSATLCPSLQQEHWNLKVSSLLRPNLTHCWSSEGPRPKRSRLGALEV